MTVARKSSVRQKAVRACGSVKLNWYSWAQVIAGPGPEQSRHRHGVPPQDRGQLGSLEPERIGVAHGQEHRRVTRGDVPGGGQLADRRVRGSVADARVGPEVGTQRGEAGPGAAWPPTGVPPRAGALTSSELAVVRLVADGLTNREVAERLYVSPHTASGHLRHAFEKLRISTRVTLSRIAAETESSAERGRSVVVALAVALCWCGALRGCSVREGSASGLG